MYIIYPCMYNDLFKVKKEYEEEYKIAKGLGFDVLLFNYDDYSLIKKYLITNLSQKLTKVCSAVYRGNIMSAEFYEKFYNDLLKQNIKLINSPEEYKNTLHFNISYEKLKSYAVKTLFFKPNEQIDFINVKKQMTSWVMEDYMKSIDVKQSITTPLCEDTKLENELLEDFRQQFNNNGGYFTIKGICLKENIDYQWDKSIHSYRAFYYKGKLLTIITTGDNLFDIVPQDFANKMPILNSNLYSIDFVKTKDDKIYVIDTNDAQISSIHNKEDLNEFYKNLYLYK